MEELEAALDNIDLNDENVKAELEPKIDAKPHPEKDKVLEVFGSLVNSNKASVERVITEVTEKLNPYEQRYSFPEELFVKFFLPFFVGEIPATPEINMNTWLDKVSGDPKNPVDIIDNEGNVIFTVPPILDQSVIEQSNPQSRSMTVIERQYSRLKEISAVASQMYLEKTLTGIHVKDKPTEEVYNNIRVWNDILKRYGKEDKIVNIIPIEEVNKHAPTHIEDKTDISDYELDTD